ncbi:tetratricopeptide repeat protein [Geomonas sp. Red32]|uniref:tetratricopeptide repeat protein n=1 Tax=Geomonas sp. Red32 TaxID=2912856 RepID=UPI00202CF463|nr:tetratricopeptide repeat protein [Geomonas sp. Red32]MCM0083676.1 tetratricopeptide repeat protein [Geomonas sp. Red32]
MIEDAISFWTDIQRFENMLAADPRSYCFVPLSELYRKLGLLDDAIMVASKGCGLHPDYPGGFFALGAAYGAKGETASAMEALEKAVELKPDHVEALKLLGQIYVQEGLLEKAEGVLVQALNEHPDDTETSMLLHSIAPQLKGGVAAAATAKASAAVPVEPETADEEIIEDIDLIEELTEIEELEEEPAALQHPASQAAAAPAQPAAPRAPLRAAVSDEEDFRAFDDGDDFWAVEPETELVEAGDVEELGGGASIGSFEEIGQPAASAASPVQPSAAEPARKDPLTTATLAELYVSQGFVEKAVGVYRELLTADPGNTGYRERISQLERAAEPQPAQEVASPPQPPRQPAPQQAARETVAPAEAVTGEGGAPPADLEAALNLWLENIRRRRDGV